MFQSLVGGVRGLAPFSAQTPSKNGTHLPLAHAKTLTVADGPRAQTPPLSCRSPDAPLCRQSAQKKVATEIFVTSPIGIIFFAVHHSAL